MKYCIQKYLSPLQSRLSISKFDGAAISRCMASLYAFAKSVKAHAGSLAAHAGAQIRKFSLLDLALLKFCLLSLGLWLGARFSRFFRRFRVFIFLGFIASYVYLIWRIFFQDE